MANVGRLANLVDEWWRPDDYEVVKVLAGAIHGEILLVKKKSLASSKDGGLVVAKKIPIEALELDLPSLLEDVGNEIQITRELSMLNVPFCVRTGGTFVDDKHVYFLLEYCAAGDLFEVLQRSSVHLNADSIRHFAYYILQALGHLHNKGYCHRDLSIENIFVDRNGIPRLGDFGQAKKYVDGNGKAFAVVGKAGKPLYRAPETDRPYHGPSADMFSFGVILFTMIARSCPWKEPNMNDKRYHILQTCGSKRLMLDWGIKRPDIPDEVFSVIDKCLSPTPNERPFASSILTSCPWFQVHPPGAPPSPNAFTVTSWNQICHNAYNNLLPAHVQPLPYDRRNPTPAYASLFLKGTRTFQVPRDQLAECSLAIKQFYATKKPEEILDSIKNKHRPTANFSGPGVRLVMSPQQRQAIANLEGGNPNQYQPQIQQNYAANSSTAPSTASPSRIQTAAPVANPAYPSQRLVSTAEDVFEGGGVRPPNSSAAVRQAGHMHANNGNLLNQTGTSFAPGGGFGGYSTGVGGGGALKSAAQATLNNSSHHHHPYSPGTGFNNNSSSNGAGGRNW